MGIRPEDITDYEDAVKSEFEQKHWNHRDNHSKRDVRI